MIFHNGFPPPPQVLNDFQAVQRSAAARQKEAISRARSDSSVLVGQWRGRRVLMFICLYLFDISFKFSMDNEKSFKFQVQHWIEVSSYWIEASS